MKLMDKLLKQEDASTGLHTGEAYVLWTQLQARYDTLELLNIMYNFVNDADLKILIESGSTKVIEPHIKKLEETIKHYKLPFPPQPPKPQTCSVNLEAFRDEGIFRIIMSGSQTALLVHIKAVNISTNDSLRNLFMNFIIDELHLYDNMVKYGKLKGWVHSPPQYKTQ